MFEGLLESILNKVLG